MYSRGNQSQEQSKTKQNLNLEEEEMFHGVKSQKDNGVHPEGQEDHMTRAKSYQLWSRLFKSLKASEKIFNLKF